ncbi:uncharacterized protein LOC121053100 isoform X2 [Rosa chinensis]|uniref:uncharacterized protein LOC121053100 isoform X2 n=1 Tax=Rosa chinensis TaxID=74649 RepID=UPI001AD8E244|nr:uncharacterized protein LOC121053100 isoform X2 [Rosa chinensis]
MSRISESGQVPKPAKPRRTDEIPTHGTTMIFIKTNELVIVGSDSRISNGRSNRIAITSNMYATCTGLFRSGLGLFEDLRKQYMEKKNSGVEPTLKEIADYGRQRIRTWDNDAHYSVIGIENGKPQAYGFTDKEKYKDTVALKTWWSFGSGGKYAKPKLRADYNRGMSEPLALKLAETTFLAAALGDPFTGGYLRVFVFDSNGKRKEYSKTTLELYLSYYSLSDEFHSRTIYIFSRGQIGDTVVTQWFSSGCLIEPVEVMVVHPVGYIGGYIVRRVVFQEKDAATIIQEVQHQCERYGCRDRTDEEINTFPCLQIVNERFHFAKLTKEQLSNLLGQNA